MASGEKRTTYNKEQDRRIRRAVEAHERKQPYFRPQAIKPRFSGGKGSSLIHFQLVEDLILGSSAEAQVLKLSSPGRTWTVDEDAEHIQVYDVFHRNPAGSSDIGIASPGMWAGKQYMRGWAQKRAGATRVTDTGETEGTDDDETRVKYDIVWMEQLAAWIKFIAQEDMGETESMAVKVAVVGYDHQGISPVEILESESDDVFVYDDVGEWSDIVNGSMGHAFYDYSQQQYQIVYCDRVVMFATARLTEDMCGSSSSASIDTFQPITHGDFNRAQSGSVPSTAYNDFKHAGQDNDGVLLMRTTMLGSTPLEYRWVVIDVEKHESEVVTNFRLANNGFGDTYIQKKIRTAWLEWCDSETPEWIDVIQVSNCNGEEE